MNKLFYFCLLGVCVFNGALSWSAPSIGLYSVELTVNSQSKEERKSSAGDALLALLTRITGLKIVPRTPKILEALENSEHFYGGYVYSENSNAEAVSITYQFDRQLVSGLVKEANLPLWWNIRPKILTWVALDDGETRILAADEQHLLVGALQNRAKVRGISNTLPLMDINDLQLISYKEIKTGTAYKIDDAALRYGADISLIGKLREIESLVGENFFSGCWEFWLTDQLYSVNFENISASAAGALGIDLVADTFSNKYSVFSKENNSFNWVITGITDSNRYVSLMDYFRSLDFIDDVFVSKFDREEITLKISTRAEERKLIELFTSEGWLASDLFYRGIAKGFRWIGE